MFCTSLPCFPFNQTGGGTIREFQADFAQDGHLQADVTSLKWLRKSFSVSLSGTLYSIPLLNLQLKSEETVPVHREKHQESSVPLLPSTLPCVCPPFTLKSPSCTPPTATSLTQFLFPLQYASYFSFHLRHLLKKQMWSYHPRTIHFK